jgi:trehalose 6-phosphate phosphatase
LNPLYLSHHFDLSPHRIGLFLDVDGTLLDLAPSPDAVEVPAALLADLAAIERRLGGALALVSGRPIAELDRLFPLGLKASGVHGAEIRGTANGAATALTQARLPDTAWQELQLLLQRFPRTFAENKGVDFTIHHRFSDSEKAPLRTALTDFTAGLPGYDLDLVAGHLVFEIRPAGFHKGKAIERFMAVSPFAGRCPVFIADDPLDQPGFDAALRLGGFAFSVGEERPGLSGWFPEPQAVRTWLGEIAQCQSTP